MTGIVVDLLKLLFGQVGVIGTLCLSLAVFLGWLYREEIKAHQLTRTRYEDMNEKRFEILTTQSKVLTELKDTMTLVSGKLGEH